MIATPTRLALGLGLAALAAMALLLPGTAERLAMFARDKNFESALRAGDAAVREGARDPEMLAQLFDVHSREGDPVPARRALLDYLAQRPDDAAMLWRGVEFMEESEDLVGVADLLGRLARDGGDPAAIDRLARLHRLYGDFASERALLAQSDPAKLTAAMRWRLGALLAGEGAFAESAAILARLDDETATVDTEDRTLLFDTLLSAGSADEAARRAARWTAAGLDPAQRALFVLQLALANRDTDALRLVEATGPGAFDTSSLAWTLGTRGHVALAERIIDAGLDGADPATARRTLALYADLAVRTGTSARVLARTAELLAASDPARRGRGVLLASLLFERQGYGAIAPLRPRLTGAVLAQAPLFAASLLLHERNGTAARHFLLMADLSRLDEADAKLFAQMSLELLGPAATLDVLEARRRAGELSAGLLPLLSQAAARAGRFDPTWAILRDGRAPGGPRDPAAKEPTAKEPSA